MRAGEVTFKPTGSDVPAIRRKGIERYMEE